MEKKGQDYAGKVSNKKRTKVECQQGGADTCIFSGK